MNAAVVVLLLVLLRVSAFVAFLPPFSGRNIPHLVKVGLAICLTALWGMKVVPAGMLQIDSALTESWLLLGWMAIRETMLGAALGWLLGLILVPMRVAGAYIVQEMGLTIGAIASPTEATESNVVSEAFEVTAVLFLFGSNIHHQFLRLFDATFQTFPLGKSWDLPSRDWLIGSIVHSTDRGLAIAAPVAVVLFAALITTLIVMRQTPSFNMFSFGIPVRLCIGLAALFWFLPGIIAGMVHTFCGFANFPGL